MKTIAGIDLGTQSLKVVVYNYEEQKMVAKTSYALDLISATDGTREQKTEWYDKALLECFNQIPEDIRLTIQAIGVSGQQHGFVPLDKDNKPLYNVKLWNDTSTQKECDILTTCMGGKDNLIEEIGNLMLPGFTASKILWFKKNKPQLWQKLHYILLPHDYINLILTNNYFMEYGDASGTALFNPYTRQWSKKVCDFIDSKLYALLPPLIQADKAVGELSHNAAKKFGLTEGILVSSGGGDNMMAAIGTGTVDDGFLTMSLGTSGTLYGCTSHCIAQPLKGISGFCSSTDKWLPLLCTMNCTVVTEEIRSLFNLSLTEFDKMAEKSRVGAEGINILPFFNGERTPPLPNGKASIMGLHIKNNTKENICRAAMESTVFALYSGFEAFKQAGFEPKQLCLTGGGSKSILWRHIVSDIFELPVNIPVFTEAAALGASLQALWCLQGGGEKKLINICKEHVKFNQKANVLPNYANSKSYKIAYTTYVRFVNALGKLYQ